MTRVALRLHIGGLRTDAAFRFDPHEAYPCANPSPPASTACSTNMTAAFLHTLPRVMGWSRPATTLLDAAGASATAYSLLTDYELGVVKALPVKAHLTLDALSGGTLIGAAIIMEDEDPEVRATLAAAGRGRLPRRC